MTNTVEKKVSSHKIELIDEKRKDIFLIDPRTIIVDENFNIRVDYGDVEALALSIAENGVITPMRGYRGEGGMVHLTDGYRRNRAIQHAIASHLIDVEKDEFRVPFIMEKRGYRMEDRILDMFITQDNKPLSAIEVAEVFHRLHHKFEMTVSDIAKKVGRSVVYVSDMLELAGQDVEVRNAVKQGKIKATAVVVAAKEVKREKKNNTAPDNSIDNDLVKAKVLDAIENATKQGKTVAGKRNVAQAKRSNAPLGALGKVKELRKIMDDQKMCPMVTDVLDEVVNYLEFNQTSIADQMARFDQLCVTWSAK